MGGANRVSSVKQCRCDAFLKYWSSIFVHACVFCIDGGQRSSIEQAYLFFVHHQKSATSCGSSLKKLLIFIETEATHHGEQLLVHMTDSKHDGALDSMRRL